MKKHFIIWFVIGALLFGCALAEPEYVDKWVSAFEISENETSFTIFELFPDKHVYYLRQSFFSDRLGGETKGIYKWEEIDEFEFRIIDKKNNVVGEYNMINERRLLDRDGVFYAHVYSFDSDFRNLQSTAIITNAPTKTPEPTIIPTPTEMPHNNLVDGLLIDPGQYIVGEDLPAGYYRFEYYKAPVDIFVHKNPESSIWSGYASVNENHPVYAKIYLPEGARVDIGAFPVIIMYAKKLDIGE